MRSRLVVKMVVVAVMLVWFPLASYASEVVVVSNNGVSAASVSKKDIKQIFLGKKSRWDDGKNVVFVTFSDTAVHEKFLKKYIGKTSSQFRSYWKKQVFTGKGKKPKTFKSANDLISYVSQTNGAVGYVGAGAKTDSVKILPVTE